ncbi:MAG TPA: PAS domain S-box protein [Kofleriaceae bacterium]|nr:PAS domain S-box protein [Kofleriaceae bacterium]
MADLRDVVRAAPDRYLILAPDLTIVEVSDAYLEAVMRRRDELVGRGVFEAFPDDPSDATPDGVANLRASLGRVLGERQPHAMAVQRYPIPRPDGGFEERFWKPLNSPVLAEDGQVRYIIHRVEDVTSSMRLQHDRVELDRALHSVGMQSEQYRELLDHASIAVVVVGDNGRIRLVNQQTEALFGYARDELVGQPLELLIPERFRRGHVGHLARFFASPQARPMGSRLELYGRRKDASEVPIEVSLTPQRDEHGVTVSAAIRDISARRRFEAEARLAADRLRSAVDSIQDAFALFDAEDRLIMCNSVFRRLVHAADPESVVGKAYAEVLDAWIGDLDFPDEAAREQFRHERVTRRHVDPTATFDVRLRDGRVLRIADRPTAEGGIVKTIWDLTDDERRAAELREARAAAEAASAAKSEFLASMSHELRTPLNAVLGFAQLMLRDRREALSARHRERVEQILGSGEHLLRLIDDVLDLARIEAGRISLSLEPVSVADVLAEVTRTLEPIATRQKVVLEVRPLPDGLPSVIADRTRFAQVLMNFGSNAIKYNRAGGRVRLEVSMVSAETVRTAVADTGMGIPLDKQAKLFQPFQRAGQETGPIQGTGIGLVITKRLAGMMHGTVGFRSVQDEGSEFWIDLPAERREAVAQRAVAAPRREAAPRPADQRHLVLCVEDNPANIVFMRDLMSTIDDIDLVTVPTAELGIELARARHPELVLMDINLPGMSGLDALRALQADAGTRHIPVIALTAAASERDRQRGKEAGFYRYLSKPANVDELIEAIDSALKGEPQR